MSDDPLFAPPSIDRNIPLPPRRFHAGHPFGLLRTLEPGGSIFFRGVLPSTHAYRVLSNRMAYLKRMHGAMLTMRSGVEGGSRGVRVWRRA